MDFYFLLGFGPGPGSDVSSPRLVGVFYTGGFSLQISSIFLFAEPA